ncbi:MAG: sugar ABC transporter permease [Ruminococcaceae bacterium]|nr:sugar ABC transporter permease [Oscillospiraceae bacterium]
MRARRTAFLWLCIAPAVVLFVIFMAIPTGNVFRLSLFQRSTFQPEETFVGLQNFRTLLQDKIFIRSMQNTLLLIVAVTLFTMGGALIFAGILTGQKLRGQNFFRVVFYIPNILSVVVISGIFSAIYDVDKGLLNSILQLFGHEGILWKGEQYVIASLIIAMVWQALGYYMVMYMAAMAAVPKSLYESAALDGAGGITQFFKITVPLIWTNIRTTLTFFIISTINMAFLFVSAMTGGGPNNASNVTLLYMYNQKNLGGGYGYAMAIGVVLFLVSFGLSALVNRFTRRETPQY